MRTRLAGALTMIALGAAAPAWCDRDEGLVRQVREAERGFAKTMAARDIDSFATYISEEALFFGRHDVLRGRSAVAAGWKRFFDGEKAPFSWEPEIVEVLDSGTLALSSGPVRDPEGVQIGTFSSIWRLEGDGRWRVIFDKGCPHCEAGKKP